jgi:proteasome lid subunit RPN8/RPN11
VLNLSKFLPDIEEHFKEAYPREACGVIAVHKGKPLWIACENIALNDEDFKFNSKEYLTIKSKHDIIAIIHSHPNAPSTPSEHDKAVCDVLGIPYYIFSYPEMDLSVYTPKTTRKPLLGRIYEFGKSDCYEAAKDWYIQNNYSVPNRDAYEDDWWLKNLNYFTDEHLAQKGMKKADTPEYGSFLVFSVDSTVPNHCGIYLGNDLFFHHSVNRLSCRENLYPFWIKYLTGIYKNAS